MEPTSAKPPIPPDHSSSHLPPRQAALPEKVKDALAYVRKVKTHFAAQPSVYRQFLGILEEFEAETVDLPGAIRRVTRLFDGSRNLLLGFNTFLPQGYKLELRGDEGKVSTGFTSPDGVFRPVRDEDPDGADS